MDKARLLEVLQQALDMENWAVNLYNDNLDRAGDEKARAMFTRQIEQSSKHALQIRLLIDQLKAGKAKRGSFDSDVLLMAKQGLQEEDTMFNFYKYYLKLVKDPQVKNLFKHLMNEEKMHKQEMNSLIKYLSKLPKKK